MEPQGTPGASSFSTINYASLIDRYGSIVKDLTDPSYLLPQMENDLRRQRETKNITDGEWKVTLMGEPLINEEGLLNVMAIARGAISNIAVLNELPQDTIVLTMEGIYNNLIKALMKNGRRYGIHSLSDNDLILSIILIPIWLVFNRARNGGEREFWQNRPGIYEPSQDKGGLWNIFKRGG